MCGRLLAATAVPCAALLGGCGRSAEPPVDRLPQAFAESALGQSLAILLGDWIARSRDSALAQGVRPIPSDVRAALTGYVPEEVLDRVRWRVGGGGELLSLQENLFRFGYAPAVTLDYVVIFQDERIALEDPKLWAHELKHVMQYAEWGVAQFAARYVRDYEAVEREAAEYRWEWMTLTGRVPPVPASGATAAE